MSIETEVLAALAGKPDGLRRRELFGLCDSAGTDIEVSIAIKQLKDSGVIQIVTDRKGNVGAAYALVNAAPDVDTTDLEIADLLGDLVNENPETDFSGGYIPDSVLYDVLRVLQQNPDGIEGYDLMGMLDSLVSSSCLAAALTKLNRLSLVDRHRTTKGCKLAFFINANGHNWLAGEGSHVDLPDDNCDLVEKHAEAEAEKSDHFDLILKSLVAIKGQINPPRVIDDLDIKLQCLNQMAALFNQDIADTLYAIAADLESA